MPANKPEPRGCEHLGQRYYFRVGQLIWCQYDGERWDRWSKTYFAQGRMGYRYGLRRSLHSEGGQRNQVQAYLDRASGQGDGRGCRPHDVFCRVAWEQVSSENPTLIFGCNFGQA